MHFVRDICLASDMHFMRDICLASDMHFVRDICLASDMHFVRFRNASESAPRQHYLAFPKECEYPEKVNSTKRIHFIKRNP